MGFVSATVSRIISIYHCVLGNGVDRLFTLVVIWSVLHRHMSFSNVIYCPSAEEGQAYALDCRSRSQSIRWQLVSLSEVCPQNDSFTCDWNKIGHVNVTRLQYGGLHINRLTISHVTHYLRYQIIECVLDEDTSGTKTMLTDCQMDIFLKPESAKCEVSKIKHNHIRVTCHTSRVFPKLRCHVTQRDEIRLKTTDISQNVTYENELLHNQGADYYNSSCSVEVLNLRPGKYSFFGLLSPAVNYTGFIRNITVPVKPINIIIHTPLPHVAVLPPDSLPTYICPNTSYILTFTCQAKMFEYRPHFEWMFTNTLINQSHIVSGLDIYNVDEIIYVSNCTINVNSHHVFVNVGCSASSSNQTANGQFTIHFKQFHHFLPVFSLQNGRSIYDTLQINKNDKSNLSCHVNTEETQDYQLNITCLNDHDVFLSSGLWGTRNTLFLNGSSKLNGSNCTCTATHQCFTLNSTIAIEVLQGSQSTVDTDPDVHTSRAIPGNSHIIDRKTSPDLHWLIYSFVGAIGLIWLLLILITPAVFLRIRCRRKQPRYQNCATTELNHIYETVG